LSEAEIKQNPFIYTVKAVELRQTLETNNEGMSTLTLGRSNLCISDLVTSCETTPILYTPVRN